jgi:hypothetical protein
MRMIRSLALLLLLVVPSAARAEKLPRSQEHPVEPLPVKVTEAPLTLDVVHDPAPVRVVQGAADGGEVAALGGDTSAASTQGRAAPQASAGPEGVSRFGAGPWLLLGAPAADADCRAPRISSDAFTAIAICRGTDPAARADEHVVIRQGDALLRYPVPLGEADGEVDLAADGMRFAGSFRTGSGRAVHLVDLGRRTVLTLGGGWRAPGSPVLADASPSVAFVARVGGKATAVLARLGETRDEDHAIRLWSGGEPLTVRGIAQEGRRVLITAKAVDLVEAILIEGEKGIRFDLSERKGDVEGAALHPGGDQVLFSSRVGGACAVFWVDLSSRRRDDFLGSVEHCYGRVGVDDSRRLVSHEGVRGSARRGFVWDRKRDEARLILPAGCADPRLSDDGRFVAARCTAGEPGNGTWLFAVPAEEKK